MQIEIGDHFWAKMGDEILVIIKDSDSLFYACGGWEQQISEGEFTVISKIELPNGYTKDNLYYL